MTHRFGLVRRGMREVKNTGPTLEGAALVLYRSYEEAQKRNEVGAIRISLNNNEAQRVDALGNGVPTSLMRVDVGGTTLWARFPHDVRRPGASGELLRGIVANHSAEISSALSAPPVEERTSSARSHHLAGIVLPQATHSERVHEKLGPYSDPPLGADVVGVSRTVIGTNRTVEVALLTSPKRTGKPSNDAAMVVINGTMMRVAVADGNGSDSKPSALAAVQKACQLTTLTDPSDLGDAMSRAVVDAYPAGAEVKGVCVAVVDLYEDAKGVLRLRPRSTGDVTTLLLEPGSRSGEVHYFCSLDETPASRYVYTADKLIERGREGGAGLERELQRTPEGVKKNEVNGFLPGGDPLESSVFYEVPAGVKLAEQLDGRELRSGSVVIIMGDGVRDNIAPRSVVALIEAEQRLRGGVDRLSAQEIAQAVHSIARFRVDNPSATPLEALRALSDDWHIKRNPHILVPPFVAAELAARGQAGELRSLSHVPTILAALRDAHRTAGKNEDPFKTFKDTWNSKVDELMVPHEVGRIRSDGYRITSRDLEDPLAASEWYLGDFDARTPHKDDMTVSVLVVGSSSRPAPRAK